MPLLTDEDRAAKQVAYEAAVQRYRNLPLNSGGNERSQAEFEMRRYQPPVGNSWTNPTPDPAVSATAPAQAAVGTTTPSNTVINSSNAPAQAQYETAADEETAQSVAQVTAPNPAQVSSVTNPAQPGLDDSSEAILSARGLFYRVELTKTTGPGIYAIDELNRFEQPDARDTELAAAAQFAADERSSSPILITGVEFNQSDITSQVPCLNNDKVFYSFGQNFGQVVITGEILLGPLGAISKEGVNRLIDFFWKNRVSKKLTPIAVSVSQNGYLVYLAGLKIMAVDPQFHIMPFVLFGTLLDISREDAFRINPKSTVFTAGGIENSSLFKALTVRNVQAPELPTTTTTTTPAATSKLGDKNATSTSSTPAPDPHPTIGQLNDPSAVLLTKTVAGGDYALTPDDQSYAYLRDKIQRDTKNGTADPTDAKALEVLGNRVVNNYNNPDAKTTSPADLRRQDDIPADVSKRLSEVGTRSAIDVRSRQILRDASNEPEPNYNRF